VRAHYSIQKSADKQLEVYESMTRGASVTPAVAQRSIAANPARQA
jgi:hypothetical protein